MTIQLNGEPKQLEISSATISQLLEQLGWHRDSVAVAVNETVVPRAQHATHELQDEDRVEIIRAVQGG